jgi:hypothetical protein
MRLCSHVITDDTGLAPNPFHGYCTSALCTPSHTNAKLKEGDWLIGNSPKKDGNRLVYAMRISEVSSARSRNRMEHPKNSAATICITNLASINGGAYLHDSITTATILLMTWVEPLPGILSSYLSISTISDPGGWLSLSVWVPSSRIGRVSVTRMTTWPTNLCRGWRLTTNLESWERHATWGITLAKPAQ